MNRRAGALTAYRRSIPAALALVALGGCHSSFSTAPPVGFVEVAQGSSAYDFRATSADGLVVAVRELEHDPEGSAEFWARAVQNAMRERGGYALLDTKEIVLRGGLRATQMRFGHDEGKAPHLYQVTVLVTDASIYLLEAGGQKNLVDQGQPVIDRWLQEFAPQRCGPFPVWYLCRGLSVGDQPAPAKVPELAPEPGPLSPEPPAASVSTVGDGGVEKAPEPSAPSAQPSTMPAPAQPDAGDTSGGT